MDFAQTFVDVIGRSSNEMLVVRNLVELGERGFNECGCTTNQCNHPHPEHGSRSTNGYGCCYACQVACSHTCCYGYGKGLERRNLLAMLSFWGFQQQSEHLRNHTELHELAFPCEPQSTCYEHANQDVSPKPVYNRLQHQIRKIIKQR